MVDCGIADDETTRLTIKIGIISPAPLVRGEQSGSPAVRPVLGSSPSITRRCAHAGNDIMTPACTRLATTRRQLSDRGWMYAHFYRAAQRQPNRFTGPLFSLRTVFPA